MYLSKFVLFIHSDISNTQKDYFYLASIEIVFLYLIGLIFHKILYFLKWDEIYFPETCNSCSLQIDKI